MTASTSPSTITLDGFAEVRDAFRQHDLEQALYDASGVVMSDALLVLHGARHRLRRRVENRLFRRGTFRYWERSFLKDVVADTLAPFVEQGNAELLELGYRTIMNLTAMVAGVDQPRGTAEETDKLYRFAKKFSEGAILVHSTRDPEDVRSEVADALAEFHELFLRPSIARRQGLLTRFEAGEIGEDALPRDVLTALLRNWATLELDWDLVLREIAFYLQAGSHSTADTFTHSADDLFTWERTQPEHAAEARRDPTFLQRCVYETLRLHPASPVAHRRARADIELRDGTRIPEGAFVVLDLANANRDPAVFADPDTYDPLREVPPNIPPWGHAFGGGMHACIGTELAGGVPAQSESDEHEHVLGTVTLMLQALLGSGAIPDPDWSPERDTSTARDHFAKYPVVFTGG